MQAKEISDFVIDTLTRLKGEEWVNDMYTYYEKNGYDTLEKQKSELVADQMFEVFANERAVNEFVAKDRSFAQKVLDHIKGLINEIKSIYKQLVASGKYEDMAAWQEDLDALQKVNDMMLDALSNIEQRKNAGHKTEKNTSDEVVNATKRIINEDVKAAQSIGRKSINSLTSAELNKLSAFAEKYWNELGTKSPFFRAWFGDWRENDTTPIVVATQKGSSRGLVTNDDTGWEINVSAKVFDESKGQQSAATVKARPYLNYIQDIIKNAVLLDSLGIDPKKSENSMLMHSFYCVADIGKGKEVLKLYVEEMYDPASEGTNKRAYKLKSIEKASTASGKVQGKSPSSVTNTVNALSSVSDLFSIVKQKDKNFSPKPASKIVNTDGTPKIVYHGTPNQFTEFDKKKARSSGYYGRGFYFTDSESHSSHYGNAMAVYLDVKNPLEQGKNHISKKQLRNFLEAVAENEDDYDIWNYGTENIDEIINNIYRDDAFAVIQDVNATAIGDLAEAIDLFNKVNKTNYDGVITPTETVVYKPTQIKSATDNIGTFDKDNPDIRFSTKRAVEETKDLIAVHNMQESELLKTLQLGGFPMPSIAIIKAQQGHSEYGPVSVVFNKSTIDPSANKNNKVYGGDAWTPTYPTIEYKVNDKAQEKISNLYYEIYRKYGADEARPLYNYVYDLERQLNSNRGEAGMIESLKDDERLMQLYLLQSGKGKIEPVAKQTVTELSEADVEMYDYLISAVGKDVVSEFKTPPGKNPLQYRTEFYNKNGEKIENAYKQMLRDNFGFTDEQIDNVINNMRKGDFVKLIRQTYQYMVNGKTTTKEETDSKATSEAIRNAIKGSGFNQWVDDLFKGVEEKSGIRNNADYFTASGNRRSWEALHWENTLENVVKVMKSQNNGVAAFFSGHAIWAVSAKDYKSIDEVKADSDRLKSLPKEEYDAIKEGFGMRLNEIATSIMDKSESNQFIAADNAMQCIVEAVRNSKTKSGVLNELRQYRQLDVTETAVDDIVSLVSDISNMPTEYFEAKPQRAVGLDEIAYVVVPDTSTKLVNTLNERGIETRTYTAGDEADRVRALNSDESVLFSTKRWYPDMPKSDLDTIKRMAKNELNKTDNYLDNITKWLYNTKNGKNYFALYSTENESEPTILYASIDDLAVSEYEFLMYYNEYVKEMDGGYDVRWAETVDEIFGFYKNTVEMRSSYSGYDVGGKQQPKTVQVHNGTSGSRISGALRNCLQNIFDRRDTQRLFDDVNKYSTKRETSISEEASDYILDTKEYQEIMDIVNQRYNLTNRKTLSPKAIDRLAGSLLTKAKSKYDKGALTERLSALFDYMANSNELVWEDVMKTAAEISHDILSQSSTLDRSMQNMVKYICKKQLIIR